MRRLPSVVSVSFLAAAALALGGVLGRSAAGADGPLTRSFAPQNVKLTVPSEEWTFADLTPQEKEAHYVAHVVRKTDAEGVFVEAYAMVAPTNGLSLTDRMHEMLQEGKDSFETTEQETAKATKLSGLDGKVVVVRGTSKSGGKGLYLWHVVEQGGTFHALLVNAYNGAEGTLAGEIDALRRGYRLLKGAGPEEPAPASPPDLSAPADGGEGGTGTPDDWPPKGPKLEGHTVTFPTRNLKWTLSEPWDIAVVMKNEAEPTKAGYIEILLALRAKLPGLKPDKPREGEPETEPMDAEAVVKLWSGPAQPGSTPVEYLNDEGFLKHVSEQSFDQVDMPTRRIENDAPVGNLRGVAMQVAGKKGDKIRFLRIYIVHLKGMHYRWEITLDGDKYADDVFKEPVKALMKAVEFPDTTEPARGPWAIEGLGHDVATRGKPGDGKEIAYSGFHWKRPKDLYHLDVSSGGAAQGFQLGVEARSPDGKSYFYLDVSVRSATELGRQDKKIEDLVGDRKTAWETGATSPSTGKGKEPYSDGSFGPGKGVTYRFTGTFQETPAVERGWIVKVKDRIFWIREQFVGPDAEKGMARTAKTAEKAIQFDK